jgi:hypothetical protein
MGLGIGDDARRQGLRCGRHGGRQNGYNGQGGAFHTGPPLALQ